MQKVTNLFSFDDTEIEDIVPIVLSKIGVVSTIEIFEKYIECHIDSKKIDYKKIIIKNLGLYNIIEIAENNPFLKFDHSNVICLYLQNNPDIDGCVLKEIYSILIFTGNVWLLEMVELITGGIIISKDVADKLLKYKLYNKKASFIEKMEFIKMGDIESKLIWFDCKKSSISIR